MRPIKPTKVVLPPKIDVGPILPFDPKKLPDPKFEVADIMGVEIGWRAWAIDEELPAFGVSPKLWSATQHFYWTPRKRSEAICSKPNSCSRVQQHKDRRSGETFEFSIGVPGENCGCGFYSAKDFNHLQSMGYHQYYEGMGGFKIVGKVANWGKVIECDLGWRAQYSYPVKLFCPIEAQHLAIPLKQAYGVPVVLRDILDAPSGGEPRRIRSRKEIEAEMRKSMGR
jgi:hypothetical protein